MVTDTHLSTEIFSDCIVNPSVLFIDENAQYKIRLEPDVQYTEDTAENDDLAYSKLYIWI